MNTTKILEVKNLKTYFFLDEGVLKALDDISLTIHDRETHGVIGESGCGKSVASQSIMRITPAPGKTVGGQILFYPEGRPVIDMVSLPPKGKQARRIRGKEISMVFQEPMTSFSPVHTIGNQIGEAIRLHHKSSAKETKERTLEILDQVGFPDPRQRHDDYAFQLSGGLRQRAMIAMALSCNPTLLIADEPTTALDVTVQAQILDLMEKLQDKFGMAILYITHDLGVIAGIADYISVMYLGKIVEQAKTTELFKRPTHPYTQRLLQSIPKRGKKKLEPIEGNVPVPLDFPEICGFFSRCPEAQDGVCNQAVPPLEHIGHDHKVRCYFAEKFYH